MLKDAIFKSCDLSMADFRNSSALGIEIRHCRAQGADFRGASFMNMITTHWFCSAYITNTNLSYANFSKVVLEKCELWENRWIGAGTGRDVQWFRSLRRRVFDFRLASSKLHTLRSDQFGLGDLDIRGVDLQGVKLDNYRASLLMERLGIAVIG